MGRKSSKKKAKVQQGPQPPPPRAQAASAGPAGKPLKLGWEAALTANLLIFGVWVFAIVARDISADFYYMSSQEDEYLEWGTFWAFMIAAAACLVAGFYQRRSTGRIPWFLAGVSAFCFVVAMEEISWAQRVFAYRPPVYFLENNFQQELNFHNVISTKLRMLAVKGVMLGYGVVLPLLALIPAVSKQLARAAVVVPPVALAPSFLLSYLVYEKGIDSDKWLYLGYPFDFTGEWVEIMLGFGFLFAAIAAVVAFRNEGNIRTSRGLSLPAIAIAASWILVLGIGVGNGAMSRSMRGADTEIIEATRSELEALKRDFLSGKVEAKCGRHRRLHTYVERYDQEALLKGEFAALTAQGLPEDRARFFIDPWNSPYWIRDRCKSDEDGGRRVVFVYSFGPNRRRESSRWEILGDDVGVVIYDGKRVRRLPTLESGG